MPNLPLMTMTQNPLTGDWLCQIPGHFSALDSFFKSKPSALRFVDAVNADIVSGALAIRDGKLTLERDGKSVTL